MYKKLSDISQGLEVSQGTPSPALRGEDICEFFIVSFFLSKELSIDSDEDREWARRTSSSEVGGDGCG